MVLSIADAQVISAGSVSNEYDGEDWKLAGCRNVHSVLYP